MVQMDQISVQQVLALVQILQVLVPAGTGPDATANFADPNYPNKSDWYWCRN